MRPALIVFALILTSGAVAAAFPTAGTALAPPVVLPAPTLTGPPDGAVLTSFSPSLTWRNPTGATQVHVQVIPANNDGPGVDLHMGTAASSLEIPAPPAWYGLLPDMTYTWRVRVSDAPSFIDPSHASWSPWAQRRFKTPQVTSSGIAAVAPSSGATNVSLTPTLQWANSRSGLYYYEVQLSRDPAFETDPGKATAAVYWVLLHGGVTKPANSFSLPAGTSLEPATTYHWRVRPRVQGDGRPVAWSASFSFTTEGPSPSFSPLGPSRPVIGQYYAWYDTDTFDPATVSDIPTVRYNSDDPATIARHVREARTAGLDALALSWLGPGDRRTDGNLQKLLASGAQQGVWATITLETDKPQFSTQSQVIAALRYLRQNYEERPNWLRWQGRPVYLFWRPGGVARAGSESALQAWISIRDQADPDRRAIWIMEGLDYNLLDVFDGQFGYSVAWSPNVYNTTSSWASRVRARGDRIFMATAMPGYDDTRVRPAPEGFARDREGGAYLAQTWDAALQAAADWVNLTSFNEWIEGSQIEPSVSYGDTYLRLNKEWSDTFKAQ